MIQLLRHGFFHCDPHPGNIAVDAKGQGGSARLIFYDFGMVDTLSEDFRRALVDGFFALYEGDPVQAPRQIVQALIDSECLGGKVDRLAVESIARYFLGSFRERLALDRALPISNEEKDQMRMDTMRDIGNELAAVASDKPFRYPRALPYVLRAFNALEGVGKALDPEYDVTRIARKYLKNLIDLRDGSAAVTAWKKVSQRVGWRPKDLASVVQSPRRVTQVYETLAKLESGELQLRVRALELERAMVRQSVMQRASLHAIAACCALNVATVLSATAHGAAAAAATASASAAATAAASTTAAAVAGAGAAAAGGAVVQAAGFSLLGRAAMVRIAWAATAWFGMRAVLAMRRLEALLKGERDGNLNEYILESKRNAN
jgi:predicted unusual protein kinase regulating ubiquinone biosynthesis (AarF/ABC1/UbiB family)